ncbi:MAG: three-Cys-motif partner protein TcmP [Desulfobacterales bacterium]|nr:three-Cys-motif partner protein TcmP [Desulfobacterales bacterium]
MTKGLRYDEIGYWSEIKLDIIKEYAAAYSRILSSRSSPIFYHFYIDAFAGAGKHKSKSTGEFVLGSPANALLVSPRFREYHFIDLDEQKIESLEQLAGTRQDVYIHHGDCNHILLDKVLPRARYDNYRRALCVQDPYGLDLDWEVIYTVGQMQSVEIFVIFPVADMNRNVLWRKPEGVSPAQIDRMNRFWGDDSWRKEAYASSRQMSFFKESQEEKVSNETIAEAFRRRLKEVAGFPHVPKPIAMRNTQNAVVYYLFFASHKPVAENIVQYIFNKYENMRGN